MPQHYRFTVIGGATGSAKTRILQAIGALGEQILDLENLANHKGSVLGILPDSPQPTQKGFETALMLALAALDPARPVHVEAESRKIGNLHVPEAVIARIRSGDFVAVDATLDARVAFLLKDYDYFLTRPDFLCGRLDTLRSVPGRLVELVRAAALSGEVIFDPVSNTWHTRALYQRSQDRNYTGLQDAGNFATDDLSEDGINRLAATIVQSRTAQIA